MYPAVINYLCECLSSMSVMYSLYLMYPAVERMSLWVLLWVTVTTDFVVKFATVITKAVLALLPRPVLPLKKKVVLPLCSCFLRCNVM